jgi:hypothetical protein
MKNKVSLLVYLISYESLCLQDRMACKKAILVSTFLRKLVHTLAWISRRHKLSQLINCNMWARKKRWGKNEGIPNRVIGSTLTTQHCVTAHSAHDISRPQFRSTNNTAPYCTRPNQTCLWQIFIWEILRPSNSIKFALIWSNLPKFDHSSTLHSLYSFP